MNTTWTSERSNAMTRKLSVVAAVFAAGCLGAAPNSTGTPTTSNPAASSSTPAASANAPDPTEPTDPTLGLAPTDTSSGDPNNTFNHPQDDVDPFAILQRVQDQGPPEISTRMHSCQKLKYATLGNLLTALGVNMAKTATPPSAGQLYKGGGGAMGAPNYGARVPEAIALTAAGATKLFDIFTQAASEVIAAMPTATACMKAGVATDMFDAQGNCTLDGIACLQGAPATQAQLDVCNSVLSAGSTAAIGKAVAVATILSSAHTCE